MNEREDVLDSLLFYIHDADHTGPFDQPLYPEGWVDVGVIDCKRAAAEIKRLRAAQPEPTEAQVERAAKAIHDTDKCNPERCEWDEMGDMGRELYRISARAALRTAQGGETE